MTPFLRKLLGQNWLLLLIMLALAVFGVVAIYSATSTRADSYATDFWRKQANWVVVGVFVFMLTSLIHYRWIRWGALPMYLAGIVFLILTKFIGTKVYGARSWLHLGPINFQPAQLAVVAGIMVLALFLTQFREMHPMLRLLLCGAIAAAPCLLILMQPDLGEVIIWVPVLLALLFVGGLPLQVLDLRDPHRTRLYPHCYQFRAKTVSAATDHRVYASGYRQTGLGMGNQSIAHRYRFGWLVGQGVQGTKHANRAWVSARYCRAQRLHFLRYRRAMGIYWRNASSCRFRPAPDDMSLCRLSSPAINWDYFWLLGSRRSFSRVSSKTWE